VSLPKTRKLLQRQHVFTHIMGFRTDRFIHRSILVR